MTDRRKEGGAEDSRNDAGAEDATTRPELTHAETSTPEGEQVPIAEDRPPPAAGWLAHLTHSGPDEACEVCRLLTFLRATERFPRPR